MSKSKLALALAILAGALLALGLATLLWAAEATSRIATADGEKVGEVLIDGKLVIRLRSTGEGQSPGERAATAAQRLNDAFERKVTWKDFDLEELDGGVIVKARDLLIITATPEEADRNNTSPYLLAKSWRDNIVRALGGQVEERSERYYEDWSFQAKKIVPILNVGNQGLRVGAAQVSGPRQQVDKVKAVGLLELNFRGAVRINVYVPMASLNVTQLDRVQGCSVSALVDVRLLEL